MIIYMSCSKCGKHSTFEFTSGATRCPVCGGNGDKVAIGVSTPPDWFEQKNASGWVMEKNHDGLF